MTAFPIPDLRIVPTDSLIPHEEHDAQRSAPLIMRIAQAEHWTNPPVVAALDDQRSVILDGANRHYTLTALGYPHILVQVVPYGNGSPVVHLETWNHVVSGLSWFSLLRAFARLHGLHVRRSSWTQVQAAIDRREALAYVSIGMECVYLLGVASSTVDLDQRCNWLRAIVDVYKNTGVLNRIALDRLEAAQQLHPEAIALVGFLPFTPAEILHAARDHALLPPGISRHIIAGRALRLNYPIAELRRTDRTLAEKNADLQHWIQERAAQKGLRLYAEATYLFDE